MEKLPHLLFKNSINGKIEFTQLSRFGGIKEEEEEKNYYPLRDDYKKYLEQYEKSKSLRENNRDKSLNIKTRIEYIYLYFFDTFNADLSKKYREKYGISPVKLENFNTQGLFVVENKVKFKDFILILQEFIKNGLDNIKSKEFIYIKEFSFLYFEKLPQTHQILACAYFSIVNNIELANDIEVSLYKELLEFMRTKKIDYKIINEVIEVLNISQKDLQKILENFDIVCNVNAIRSVITKYSQQNTPYKDFGFEIEVQHDVPVIGIIDTGISNLTPLKDIIVNKNNSEFDFTYSNSSLIDNVSHGTSVAALAALGVDFLTSATKLKNHAKLLSIKIADSSNDIYISAQTIIQAIRDAHKQYGAKIFVLTITDYIKNTNEAQSLYAYWLDQLAFELDILLCICIGNNTDKIRETEYPFHFAELSANIASPSESINNLTVGALAENNDNTLFDAGKSIRKENPACYSRKYHINFEELKLYQKNKHLFKPDLVHYGGDYDKNGLISKYALTVIDTELRYGFCEQIGTSYSTPLVANLAAQILHKYPSINMQTVKALLINSAESAWGTKPPSEFDDLHIPIQNIIGHGLPNLEKCLDSNENELTYILEDSIEIKKLVLYPIHFPAYLTNSARKQILEVNATLCFKVKPIYENQLAYCPIHLAFTFVKNLSIERINRARAEEFKINSNLSWSQDYYYKAKILSNVQKLSFTIQKETLINENNTLQIALNSKVHGLIDEIQMEKYSKEKVDFSLVLRITEKGRSSNNLYEEMQAINKTEAITQINTDLDIEL